LAVYCTSWTFYGGVGAAAVSVWMFLPIYLGPALLYFFGWPFLRRLSEIGRAENTTSIADFISSRYGKSRWVATLVTVISALGALPYIALQLKAVGMSAAELTLWRPGAPVVQIQAQEQQVLFIALALAAFSVLFGARSYDATGRRALERTPDRQRHRRTVCAHDRGVRPVRGGARCLRSGASFG
jgi:Na+/proline symporter